MLTAFLGTPLVPSIRERDVAGAVAEDVVHGVRGGHAVRNRADTTDTLHERDRVVRSTAEKEVLEATPQVAVGLRVDDRRAVAAPSVVTLMPR